MAVPACTDYYFQQRQAGWTNERSISLDVYGFMANLINALNKGRWAGRSGQWSVNLF